MCIAVRWVDSTYTINEAALGLVQLPDTKALTLFSVLKDVLLRCSLSVTSCLGQAYDGASNMRGVRNGVQALMKRGRGLFVRPLLCQQLESVCPRRGKKVRLSTQLHGIHFPTCSTHQVFAKVTESF